MIPDTYKLVHEFLENSAICYPDKIALIHDDVRTTYSSINSKANQLACVLVEHGTKIGDRVILLMENSLEYVTSYYGVLKAGAVAVPLSVELKPDDLMPRLTEMEPKILISTSKCERLLKSMDLSSSSIKALILKKPTLKWNSNPLSVLAWEDIFWNKDCSNLEKPDIRVDESSLASVIYTSGSTGVPKGVMLSHANIISNTYSILRCLDISNKDIQMVVLPLFYVMGKSLLNTHFAAGGTVVFNNRFAFPASVVKQMVDEHITAFSGVPSTYAYLLYRSPLMKYQSELASLRYCSQAGGHMSMQLKKELRRVLPEHTEIFIMYGATEASARLTYLEPNRYEEKMGSIGRPIDGVKLKVMDKKGNILQPGQKGEIIASGNNIMRGYWQDPHTTSQVLDQHGYHTGDIGYQDEDGYFYVTGRNDKLIKVGGHRINPREIEDALMETGLIIEVSVLGLPDKHLGKKLIAITVPRNDDYNEKTIMNHCSRKLPRYKMPSEVRFVRSLPKNSSGKIDRKRCLAIFHG